MQRLRVGKRAPVTPRGGNEGHACALRARQRTFAALCVCRHGGGIKLLRLPACASHANKKKADSVSVFSVFSGCFVVEPRSLWMSAIPPTLTAYFVFFGFDICKIQLLRNVTPKNDKKRQSVRFPD